MMSSDHLILLAALQWLAKIATGEESDDGYMSAGCRKSGLAGAKSCAKRITKKERSAIARKALVLDGQKGETLWIGSVMMHYMNSCLSMRVPAW
jgi:hypothetical protein